MKKISRRERRILIGGGIAAVLIVLVTYVILPFIDSYTTLNEQLTRQGKLLTESVQVIRDKQLYEDRADQTDRDIGMLNRQLLDGSDEVTAQNQLETIVRELAEFSQLTVSRSFPIQGRITDDKYASITVEITVDGGLDNLAGFLQSVSTHTKYLRVDEFNISSTLSRGNTVRKLSPRMQISGFIRLSQG